VLFLFLLAWWVKFICIKWVNSIDNQHAGLSRITGVQHRPASVEAKKVLRYGEVLAIHKAWEILQVSSAIERAVSGRKYDFNIPLLVELMAINQVIKPQNKQAISDWYRCLYLPELEGKELLSHHFYRALDVLSEVKEAVEKHVFSNLSALLPIRTDLAFCRLTAGVFEPAPRADLPSSTYGKYILEESGEMQKVDFGLMVTGDGMPFGHRMLQEVSGEGDFRSILDYLKENFGIERCIFAGDRSVMGNPNLEVLVAHGYEYLIGRKVMSNRDSDWLNREVVSGRNFHELDEDLWFKEIKEGDVRYLLCYNPQSAEQKKAFLKERLDAVEGELKEIQRSLIEKRSSTSRPAFNKNASIFKDGYCRRYFEWSYNEETQEFSYRRRDDLLAREQSLAGMFILETNSSTLSGREILESYTGMARLAESLREIKNFEAKPNQFYTELNISASLLVCVLAAMLENTMERMIRRAGLNLNSRQALELLEEIKVAINQLDDLEVKSVTRIPETQEKILNAIGVGNIQRTII
ncbi:MAG: IS1634 family transposase, partial [Peptococcaceae bacterium]|nr:IS1634 family transposase [Peptococcaceae bacterium]